MWKQPRPYRNLLSLRWRLAAIAALGNKCSKCGFSDPRALCFDHVNGGGRKERAARLAGNNGGDKYYKNIINNGSGKFQILCANCNQIKRYENYEGVSHEVATAINEIANAPRIR